jgi:adenine-specific DNA-methyltransferase
MSQQFEKLKKLLMELFQLNHPDLDFGVYRIMHAKSDEITQFLDHDLLPQVTESFKGYQSADKVTLQAELDEIVKQAHSLGADPCSLPKVKELQKRLEEQAVDIRALEADVYDHLYGFFRRYYAEGDFLSKRVYKPGVYAIPYEGEEVKLHWANADQYYIKTSEYLRDYAFRLRPDETNPMRVHFRLADAAEGEHGNVRETESKTRVFIPSASDFMSVENDELIIRFEYRPAVMDDWPETIREGKKKPPVQKDLIGITETKVMDISDARFVPWINELRKRHIKTDGDTADYTKLVAHLNRYTARNTFDYFIHKDLGGFLRRELDFYIKNEVMHLDNIESETAPRVDQYLSKIKVIRRIAGKIIAFLEQIENFQKKLWLKKKFVVETNYCVTLDRVPETLYSEIATNTEQIDEWIRLFAIDQIESSSGDLMQEGQRQGFSVPVTVQFLKENDKLVLDTAFFSDDFKERLIASMDDLDEQCDGLLIHSENFQALHFLQDRYKERVKCIYIDPPYNAKSSEILYKNSYKNSSWLGLINDRIQAAKCLQSLNSVLTVAIDEIEQEYLGQLLSLHYPFHQKSCIVVNHNPSGQQGDNFSSTHEYAYFIYPKPGRFINEQTRTDENEWDERNFRDVTGQDSLREAGLNCFYPIYIKDRVIVGFGDVCQKDFHPNVNEIMPDGTIAVYPVDPEGVERKWRFARNTVEDIKNDLKVHYIRGRSIYDIKRLKKKFNYKTNWIDSCYSANNHGTQLLNKIIPEAPVSYPKSLFTVKDSLIAASNLEKEPIILDYFAGSGTTGHAVINLNREDGGRRKYILVEMGDYFDTVLKPRIQKVVYSKDWKNGKPETRDAGISQCFKVIRLESYEDTLNNLELRRSDVQKQMVDLFESSGTKAFREEYMLQYMLDVETRNSVSLLNVSAFTDPAAYLLNIKIPGSDETRQMRVDLPETFNYLLGLTVVNMAATQSITAEFERDTQQRLRIKGRISQQSDGKWWFRAVTGALPDNRKVLVIWRNRPGGDTPEGVEQDNLVLDEWFKKMEYSSKDSEFDLIYVNGGNNLENFRTPDERWKVRLIEDDFHRLMFREA